MLALFRPLLLAALIVRAMIPAGWMPNPGGLGEAALILCAADGSIHHGSGDDPSNEHQHQSCVFSVAAHGAAPPVMASLAAPASQIAAPVFTAAATSLAPAARHQRPAPRAPPLPA